MENGNPTADGGASTTEATTQERLMAFLGEEPQEPEVKEEGVEVPAEDQAIPADDGEATEEPQYTTDDLAQLLGVESSMFDADEDGGVVIKTKIDGKEGTAKFQDVLAAYQLRGHIDNQSREVAEQRKAVAAIQEQGRAAIAEKLAEVDALANAANQELMRDYAAIDWQTLRAQDPAEFAALHTDFQARQQRIGAMMQETRGKQAQLNEQAQKQVQEMLAGEVEKIRVNIPGWADPVTAKKENGEITQWALKEMEKWGEDPGLLNQVNRGFHIDILRKAMLYDQMQGIKAGVEKKVRVAPKIVRPGQAKSASQKETESMLGIKQKIKQSGGKDGVQEYLIRAGIV